MANEACPVTCHNRWWKSWEQDFVCSCRCPDKCLGGFQRWCDIFIRALWSLDDCQLILLAFSCCSDLADSWPYFCPSHWNLYGKWFLGCGLCSWGQWLFAGWLLTGTGRCPLPCHGREAEQMGPLALLVLLHLCLANVNRWWWLLPWEERWVPLGFTFLNPYSLLKERLLGYGSKRIASSAILKIKQIHNQQTLCFQLLF